MKTVKIYLKGGQTVTITCRDYQVVPDSFGRPARMNWVNPVGERIVYASLADIAMVTEEP